MIMPREKREILKEDIMPLDVYTKNRKELRKNIVNFKKDRRIALGPYATFYFESYETMLAQVQEMLYIEKGGDEQLKDELIAYNPLIPNGKELTATLMFEIDNPVSRAAFLSKVGGIEEKVFIKIDGQTIKAIPEEDVDRTSAEGKASSVQFIHFKLNDEQIEKFKSDGVEVEIGIDHKEYSHTTKLSSANLPPPPARGFVRGPPSSALPGARRRNGQNSMAERSSRLLRRRCSRRSLLAVGGAKQRLSRRGCLPGAMWATCRSWATTPPSSIRAAPRSRPLRWVSGCRPTRWRFGATS